MGFLIIAAIIACLGLAVFAARSEWERRQLKTEYYRLPAGGADRLMGRDRIRLAFLSDLHDYPELPGCLDRLLAALKEAAPDLVLLGGDIVTVRNVSGEVRGSDRLRPFLRELAGLYPVIYGYGNHESRFEELFPEAFAAYRKELENCGILMPKDRCISFLGIDIYSLDMDAAYFRKPVPIPGSETQMPEKYLIGKLGLPDRKRFTVLLMHSPLYLKEAAVWGADLVLSGHFHGGTIRLPGGRGLMTPQYQFFRKECSGIHYAGRTAMIVNRGLGTHSIRLRFHDLPELSIIDIYG